MDVELGLERRLPIAFTLSLNNFAVSLALGALGHADKRWRIALAFGAFEFAVPLLGIVLGRALSGALAEHAGWVGAAMLGGIGIWTLLGALRSGPTDQRFEKGLMSWKALLMLAFGLSLDNLIVGVGLGLRGLPPVSSAAIIAGSVFVFILLGLRLGSAARRHWERRAHVAAGVLLLALAGAMAAGWI